MIGKNLIIILLLGLFSPLYAQVKPNGRFLSDTLKVGEPVSYSLAIKYPVGQEIIFPDSSYTFAPFEFQSKRYFNTKSDSVYSYDSVIYQLATYELDSIQNLALPVFFIEEGDTTKIFAAPDSVLVRQALTRIPDTPQMHVNTNYIIVDRAFNYRYLLFGLIIFLLLILLLFLLFGKSISRKIKTKRLRAQHYKFLVSFKELGSGVTNENYEVRFRSIYALWKTYLQQLTNLAYTTYSTKEISRIIVDESLKESLQKIDRAIYAHRFPDQHESLLKVLQEYAHKFYEQKIREITNGPKKQ